MEKLQWQDGLSVGVELIDAQHRKWIDHFNNAAEALESHQDIEQINTTLGFLIDYTGTHFSTEVKLMSEHNYPGLEEHQAKHDELKKTLDDLVQDFEEEGATHLLAESVNTFLGNWLIKHIQDVDMKFGAFVKESGIVISEE